MTSASTPSAVRDYTGKVIFVCPRCSLPLSADDFFEMELRLPDEGESREDYLDSELLESIPHFQCDPAPMAPRRRRAKVAAGADSR